MQPLQLSATDLVAAVHRGDLTATECAEAFLARTEAVYKALQRIRTALQQCIDRKILAEART